jgi:hypothetical protein
MHPGPGCPRQPHEDPRLVPWRVLGTGAAVVAGEGVAAYLQPALREALAAADIVTPLAIVIVLITVILRGSNQTVDRVFRLLRWISNRPEPPAPQPPLSQARPSHTANVRGRPPERHRSPS